MEKEGDDHKEVTRGAAFGAYDVVNPAIHPKSPMESRCHCNSPGSQAGGAIGKRKHGLHPRTPHTHDPKIFVKKGNPRWR